MVDTPARFGSRIVKGGRLSIESELLPNADVKLDFRDIDFEKGKLLTLLVFLANIRKFN